MGRRGLPYMHGRRGVPYMGRRGVPYIIITEFEPHAFVQAEILIGYKHVVLYIYLLT